MWGQTKENFKFFDKKISIIVVVCLFLILIIGSTYAYFVVNSKNNVTNTTTSGELIRQAGILLVSDVSDLYLNLNGVYMSQEKIGTKYFATTDSSGTPIVNATLGNGIYTLATASIETGTTKYNCTYKYKITASLNRPITDGSDEDIKLKFTGSSIVNGSREYTLKELIDAGSNGLEFNGMFENLTAGNDQSVLIESTVENTNKAQDDFAGNRYNINISPLPGEEGFSCEINYLPPTVVAKLSGDTITANVTKGDHDVTQYCVNTSTNYTGCTWQTLSGTTINYSPTATGTYYIHVKDSIDKIGTSSGVYYPKGPSVTATLNGEAIVGTVTKGANDVTQYCVNTSTSSSGCAWQTLSGTTINYTPTATGTYYIHVKDSINKVGSSNGIYCEIPTMAKDLIASGNMWQSGLNGDGYRYTGSGAATAGTTPKNFVCFGTNDKSTCTGNPNNYMYRIIGVFLDGTGNQYVKLIKYASLPSEMAWNDTKADVDWGSATLNANLNGSTFLTNTTYVPNGTWSSKIANWKWTAVNTLTWERSGPNYASSSTYNPTNIYLHEMNRSNKASTIGEWTTPSAKIGLMYVSDYALSLGQTAKNMSGSTGTNASTLKTGWMHFSNNVNPSKSSYDWTISRSGDYVSGNYNAWYVRSSGGVGDDLVVSPRAVRPSFYLASTVQLSSGSGTLTDPYILK